MTYDEKLTPYLRSSKDGHDVFVFNNKFLVAVNTNVNPVDDIDMGEYDTFLCEISTYIKKDGRWCYAPYEFFLENMTETDVNKYLQEVLADV